MSVTVAKTDHTFNAFAIKIIAMESVQSRKTDVRIAGFVPRPTFNVHLLHTLIPSQALKMVISYVVPRRVSVQVVRAWQEPQKTIRVLQ